MLALSIQLRKGWLRWNFIENIILFLAGLNVIVVGFQMLDVMYSSNPFISITGLNENPSSTAIYLIGALVVVLNRIMVGKRRKINLLLYLLLTFIVIVLKCRTAYIGLVVLNVIYVSCWLILKKRIATKYKYIALLVMLPLLIIIVVVLYNFKQGSSQGRIFIWKTATQLIVEKPMGYGYGMFEKTYNLAQSRYFQSNAGAKAERAHADFVAMPYNDYLEAGIEGGIIGMSFFASFFALMIIVSYKKKNLELFVFFIAIALMGLVNFLYTSVSVWLMVMCFSAYLISQFAITVSDTNKYINRCTLIVPVMIVLIGLCFLYKNFRFVNSQLKLTKIQAVIKNGQYVGDMDLIDLQDKIGTSEAYYNTLGRNYILIGNYESAKNAFTGAQKYSSSPEVYYGLWDAKMRMHETDQAIESLKIIENMQPMHLLPKLYLMRSYSIIGNREAAMQYADRIVSTKAKVESNFADAIYEEANKFINEYNCGLRYSH